MKARKKIEDRLRDIEAALRFADPPVARYDGAVVYTADEITEQLLNEKSLLLDKWARIARIGERAFARRRADLRRMETLNLNNPAVARDPRFVKKLERLRVRVSKHHDNFPFTHGPID